MLKQQALKQYIKLIIESIDNDYNEEEEEYKQQELENLELKYYDDIFEKNMEEYEKNQIEYNPSSSKRWNLLNHTINLLRKIDQWLDPNFYENHYAEKYIAIQNILIDELNFEEIGEGAFRKVFSHPDAMFIVKLEKQRIPSVFSKNKKLTPSGTNKVEFNKYFDFGKKYQKENEVFPIINHTTLFPKIYAYDNLDGLWIITEKVIPITSSNTNINEMFQPFFSFLTDLFHFLDNNPAFISQHTNKSVFEIKSNFKKVFNPNQNNNNHSQDPFYNVEQIIDFINTVSYSDEATSNLNLSFQNAIIDKILTVWSNLNRYTNPQTFSFEMDYNTAHQLLTTNLQQHFGSLIPTPDIKYICNILKKEFIDDLHINNIGHRDMKLNPTEPWKNFVILDYADHGGPPQTRP